MMQQNEQEVLVVEDDPTQSMILVELLVASLDIPPEKITVAASIEEARGILHQGSHRFARILSDVEIIGSALDGVDLLTWLRRDLSNWSTIFFFVSSTGRTERVKTSAVLYQARIIHKPVTIPELCSQIVTSNLSV
jgi:CheY-like chemotaxis protein